MSDQADAVPSILSFGPWSLHRCSGELRSEQTLVHLEPKVMALLWLLASHGNRVFSRDELMQQLWPGLVVGEDTLARAVFKLRKALKDDAKTPIYVDTLPKRGYRFIHPLTPVVQPSALTPELESADTSAPEIVPLIATLRRWSARQIAAGFMLMTLLSILGTRFFFDFSSSHPVNVLTLSANALTADPNIEFMTERGNDYYAQYSRVDNQAAIELFERVIAMQPQHAPAYAGLANALIQTVIRWHDAPERDQQTYSRVRDALQRGLTKTPQSLALIERAARMARRAIELAPENASGHKALGLVLSTEGNFAGALAAYKQSLILDPDAWGAMVNIADLLDATQQDREALRYLEQAFSAMTRSYATQSAQIQPWYAEIAGLIGDRHLQLKQLDQAEHWYRRTVEIAPFEPKVSAKLAALLRQTGRQVEASDLCARLARHVENVSNCDS